MGARVTVTGQDQLGLRRMLKVGAQSYAYYSLAEAAKGFPGIARLPISLKVLLENLLRHEDGRTVTVEDIAAVADWTKERSSSREIAFRPARVLMQDFTGVPAIVDLAAMRDAMAALGGDPERINPLSPVDLVIDHSVMVDAFGSPGAFAQNVKREFERNGERYAFLRWGQDAFRNFRVVPPGTGICHQVNLEYLSRTVWSETDQSGAMVAYPDTLVGTDSHTVMVNGLSVLGWGVGGIEAEAAMLGQPISMLVPEVVGVELTGALTEGVTATDLVLTVTQILRKAGVVGKFVEFWGDGLDALSLADRATVANMAPEYGATCGFFPIDGETLAYLRLTGREAQQVALVEAYAKAQGLWRDAKSPPLFSTAVKLALGAVEPSLAGPKRPQDRVPLGLVAADFGKLRGELRAKETAPRTVKVDGYDLEDGAVVIAAITSCTNTSNPSVMIGAGILAQKALARGLKVKPWVKTSFAPGSQVVTDYMQAAGLDTALDALGFGLVGYGCTTCIGNSGPLPEKVAQAIDQGELLVAAVLSGNRNFEGRVHPQTRANYLASPPLVVAYALAGTVARDLAKEPLGMGADGKPVFLKDVWPSDAEIRAAIAAHMSPELYRKRYANVAAGPAEWRQVKARSGRTFTWVEDSTYVRRPPYFDGFGPTPPAQSDIRNGRALAILGDSVTTDHISPAGSIEANGPAGRYLGEHGVARAEFNSYGARRGNHEVMMRGTFANIRLRNEMAAGTEGGVTVHQPTGERLSIYDAAMRYRADGVATLIFAGKEYGTGSSRDWAGKGPALLGVRAVVAESFERIHRSNLIGMGVLPLEFSAGFDRKTLALTGAESFDLVGIATMLAPRAKLALRIAGPKAAREVELMARIDTLDELECFRNGGILHYVLRRMVKEA
ncbi:MAG: aconitate hydratase AcnA [Alphaproteobacteria bacterium]|nr:aconitate hydratase AcnA [Alphaproteobacteria bacterium]